MYTPCTTSPARQRLRVALLLLCVASAAWAQGKMVLLYAAASQTVYGKVLQRGRSTLIGAPPAPVAAELERLWKAGYRSGK